MSVRERIYEDKGTIIRLTFIGRSGNKFKLNPIMFGAAGFVRGLEPSNSIIDFSSSLAQFHKNTIILLDEAARQVSTLELELKEELIGIKSLVLYPNGSTWEGLVGTDITVIKSMIWSPTLAKNIKNPTSEIPWIEENDWKLVPTALLISEEVKMHMLCSHIYHSCCDPCK